MATQDPTTNYGWNLPNNGGDSGAWGVLLNAIVGDDVTGIDAVLKAVSDIANAALPKAGGTMTGRQKQFVEEFGVSDWGSFSGARSIFVDSSNFFCGTVVGNVTFTLSNPPSTGDLVSIVIELTNGGAHTVTWPSSVKWPGGVTPTLQASGVDVITMYTRNGGATWRAALAMGDSS